MRPAQFRAISDNFEVPGSCRNGPATQQHDRQALNDIERVVAGGGGGGKQYRLTDCPSADGDQSINAHAPTEQAQHTHTDIHTTTI